MPNHRVIEGSSTSGRQKIKSWRAAVVEAAQRAAGGDPMAGPLTIKVTFRLPMPRSRPKWIQKLQRYPSTVKPDLDKLVRGLLDGMVQGGLIRDDALVFSLQAVKYEVVGWTGANVAVSNVNIGDVAVSNSS